MDTCSIKSSSGKMVKSLGFIPQAPAPLILSDVEKAAIVEMRKLYMDTLKIDVDLQKRIYRLEKDLEPKYTEIYEKRSKLISEYRKTISTADHANRPIAHFWLNVLKASFTDFITDDDEKILLYLWDVRSTMFLEPEVKFTLEFYFEPNDYFSNAILTKTYFMNTLPNPELPLTYDGAEIVGSDGCKIDWKFKRVGRKYFNKIGLPRFTSFFDFFDPPKMNRTDRCDNQNYRLGIKALMQNDFELGFYLKERVIPKAVFFFTGEIIDCQNSDDEFDEDDDEDEDEENTGERHANEMDDEKEEDNAAADNGEKDDVDSESSAPIAKSNENEI